MHSHFVHLAGFVNQKFHKLQWWKHSVGGRCPLSTMLVLPPVAKVLGAWSVVQSPCIGQLPERAPREMVWWGGGCGIIEYAAKCKWAKYHTELQNRGLGLQMSWSSWSEAGLLLPRGWNIIPNYAHFNRMQNNVFNLNACRTTLDCWLIRPLPTIVFPVCPHNCRTFHVFHV